MNGDAALALQGFARDLGELLQVVPVAAAIIAAAFGLTVSVVVPLMRSTRRGGRG